MPGILFSPYAQNPDYFAPYSPDIDYTTGLPKNNQFNGFNRTSVAKGGLLANPQQPPAPIVATDRTPNNPAGNKDNGSDLPIVEMPPQYESQQPKSSVMGDIENGLANIYGAGGPGDPLIAMASGLMSRRGAGPAIAQGFQNIQANQLLQQQKQLREAQLAKQLHNDQYKTVVDDNQNIWQINTSNNKRELLRSAPQAPAQVQTAQWINNHPDEAAQLGLSTNQKLSEGDKKAIGTADETALAGKNAIANLDDALKLSNEAFDGPTAGVAATIGAPFGQKEAIATKNLENVLTTNTLGQLKSIFGGNPTEGERKILLDVQGAATQPKELRNQIIERAKAAAKNRMNFNLAKASALRDGSYYKQNSPFWNQYKDYVSAETPDVGTNQSLGNVTKNNVQWSVM